MNGAPDDGGGDPGPLAAAGAGRSSKFRVWRAQRRAKKAQRSVLRRRLTRTAITLAIVLVVLVGSGVGYIAYRNGQITSIAPKSGVLTPTKANGGIEDILLIGSTNRCAVTNLKSFEQQCAAGVNGINSDVVMVVRLDPATHKITLLSIPRDTFVPDARAGGLYNKIDAALYDGPSQLAEAITQDFGIPITHFVELNFGTFDNVVNALGGIDLDFPDRVYDPNSDLDVTRTGCVHLDGFEALELVRSRHLYYFTSGQTIDYTAIQAAAKSGNYGSAGSGGTYDGSGDLGRITRVHTFLHVLAAAVAKRGLGNPITDNSLIGAIAPDLVVDNTFGLSEMLHLILAFHGANLGSAPELTAPIIVDAQPYSYKGYPYGDVVFPTEPADEEAIAQFAGGEPAALKLSPSKISVSVVDGTNSPSATAAIGAALHALGYPIVATNATSYVGPVSETTVLYAKGHLAEAERVLSSLSGTVVMGEGTPVAGATVSVIAGSDLGVDASRTGATTTAHASGSSSGSGVHLVSSTSVASGVTTTTNPNFSAPTSAAPAPTPWDPRACPAGSR